MRVLEFVLHERDRLDPATDGDRLVFEDHLARGLRDGHEAR